MELFVFLFNQKKITPPPPTQKWPFLAPQKVAEMCRADLRFVKLLRDQIHQSRAIQFSGHETVLPGGHRNEKNTVQGPRSNPKGGVGFLWGSRIMGFLFLEFGPHPFFFGKNAFLKWKPPWNSDWFYKDM